MSEDWMPHARAFLEAEGLDAGAILQGARLALMLSPDGESAVVAVECGDNRVAWCRTYSSGWACVAIGADDGRRSVPREAFFAKGTWPKEWIKPGAIRREMRKAADAPFVAGGMAWANDPSGGVRVAMVADVEPLRLILHAGDAACEAGETGMKWRPFQHNAEGLAVEWRGGRATFHNFKLAAMRAGLRVKHLRNAAAKAAAKQAARQNVEDAQKGA